MYAKTSNETMNSKIMDGSDFFKNVDGFEADVKADQPEGENGKKQQHG